MTDITSLHAAAAVPTAGNPDAVLVALNDARRDLEQQIIEAGYAIIAGIVHAEHPHYDGTIKVSRDNNRRIVISLGIGHAISVPASDRSSEACLVRDAVAAIIPPPSPRNIGGCGDDTFAMTARTGDSSPYAGIWAALHGRGW